ncbi:hypothetical protein AB0N09_35795 [Streptomyces erythrochromogenes]|uniref:hypothetical protein n=1 Tax=Streptomyces erythrochromogenes TaxID=285574 RepID=UPI003441763B
MTTRTNRTPEQQRSNADLGMYGTLEITATSDPDFGAVHFELRAPHVRGSVIVSPAAALVDPSDALRPYGYDIAISTEVAALPFPVPASQPLSVNGIALSGTMKALIAEPWSVRPQRRTKSGGLTSLPRPTDAYARAVLLCVIRAWDQRTDRGELERAARSTSAVTAYGRHSRRLAGQMRMLRAAQGQVADSEARLAVLLPSARAAVSQASRRLTLIEDDHMPSLLSGE